MQYINDTDTPQLLGRAETEQDLAKLRAQVDTMNQWLVDSGFNQYQYDVVVKDKLVYIERV